MLTDEYKQTRFEASTSLLAEFGEKRVALSIVTYIKPRVDSHFKIHKSIEVD